MQIEIHSSPSCKSSAWCICPHTGGAAGRMLITSHHEDGILYTSPVYIHRRVCRVHPEHTNERKAAMKQTWKPCKLCHTVTALQRACLLPMHVYECMVGEVNRDSMRPFMMGMATFLFVTFINLGKWTFMFSVVSICDFVITMLCSYGRYAL